MADYYSDELHRNQKRGRTKKPISLNQQTTSSLSYIQESRAAFDQVQTIVGCSALFNNKLFKPSDARKCLRDPHCHHWISGLFSQYYMNDLTNIFTNIYQLRISPLIKNYCAMSYHKR